MKYVPERCITPRMFMSHSQATGHEMRDMMYMYVL